jgi:hypothetical protein
VDAGQSSRRLANIHIHVLHGISDGCRRRNSYYRIRKCEYDGYDG